MLRDALAVMLAPSQYDSERDWRREMVERVMPLIGATKCALRGNGPQFLDGPIPLDPAVLKQYRDYYHRFDVGRALGDARSPSAYAFSGLEAYGDRVAEFLRTEYFHDYLRPNGFLDGLGLSVRRSRQHAAPMLYVFHDGMLTASRRAREVAILELLAPAFRSGMTMGVSLGGRSSLLFGVIARNGRLLHRNPAMTALFAECSRGDALRTAIHHTVASVRALCFESVRTVMATPAVNPPSVDFQSGGSTYRVSGCALGASQFGREPAILVTVCRLRDAAKPMRDPAHLRARFGLTARESEVALLLGSRLTNAEVATTLGMSLHTARRHTEKVLRKLRADSRRQVAAMLDTEGRGAKSI
jgi:DNA-binding CsgD family transcriptional regulator